jgi:hypothetical protein
MEDSNEINELLTALDEQENNTIINLTSNKIKQQKNDILQKLQLSREKLKEFHKKLKQYRYCESLEDIQFGGFIRWIPLKNPNNIKLTNGGIICDIKNSNNKPLFLLKNNMNRFFQINFDECLVFQKLSRQENIILAILDYIDK